jgi:hypothetical protein
MSSTSRQPGYHRLAPTQNCRSARSKLRPWLPPLEDDELLSQTQVLRHQQRLRLEERRDRPPDPLYHPSLPLLSPQRECSIPSDEREVPRMGFLRPTAKYWALNPMRRSARHLDLTRAKPARGARTFRRERERYRPQFSHRPCLRLSGRGREYCPQQDFPDGPQEAPLACRRSCSCSGRRPATARARLTRRPVRRAPNRLDPGARTPSFRRPVP